MKNILSISSLALCVLLSAGHAFCASNPAGSRARQKKIRKEIRWSAREVEQARRAKTKALIALYKTEERAAMVERMARVAERDAELSAPEGLRRVETVAFEAGERIETTRHKAEVARQDARVAAQKPDRKSMKKFCNALRRAETAQRRVLTAEKEASHVMRESSRKAQTGNFVAGERAELARHKAEVARQDVRLARKQVQYRSQALDRLIRDGI